MKTNTLKHVNKTNARLERRAAFDSFGKEHFFLSRWKSDKMKRLTGEKRGTIHR